MSSSRIFGESPDFLKRSFLPETRKSSFLEKSCFSKRQKCLFFGQILEKGKTKNEQNDCEKAFDNAYDLEISIQNELYERLEPISSIPEA